MEKIKLLTLLIICSLTFTSCNGQKEQLPKPTGKYKTGVGYISLTDSSRKELFDNSLNSYRDLTIKFWYPSDQKTQYEPYLENAAFVIDNFGFSEVYRDLLTNSCKGVPVSKNRKNYPALIFSHGWGEHFSQNTILIEALASHGYVIFSIGHHYESKFSFYPDGTIVSIDNTSNRFIQIMNEQQNPEAMEVYREMFQTETDSERLQVFVKTASIMPTLLKESPEYWADDIEFLIGKLENINETNPILLNKLNLDQIGVLGMSMGGIAANELCIDNEKVKAGVNIDGGLYGSAIDTSINKPFMFINSQRYLGYGKLFANKSTDDCYSVTVKNSDHYNFTDYALYPNQSNLMVGSIDPGIPIEIMNSMILNFFDFYLKKSDKNNLQDIAGRYDVEFVSKKKHN